MRQQGKSLLMEKVIAEHLKKHPEATILRVHHGETRVEKFAESNKKRELENGR